MLGSVNEAGGRYSSEPFDAVWQIDEDSSDTSGDMRQIKFCCRASVAA